MVMDFSLCGFKTGLDLEDKKNTFIILQNY